MGKNAKKRRLRRLAGCYHQQCKQLITAAMRKRLQAWLKIADRHEKLHAEQHQSALPHKGRAMVKGSMTANHKPKRDTARIKGLHTPSVTAKRIGDKVMIRGIKVQHFVEFGLTQATPHNDGHFMFDESNNSCVFLLNTWRELSAGTQLEGIYK